MENLSKQVGYLKGLMEGMDIDKSTANGKLMAGIVDLLGGLTDRVEAMDELLDDLNDYVESIDDDLSLLEGDREDEDFRFMDGDDDDDFVNPFSASEDRLHLLRNDDDDDDELFPLSSESEKAEKKESAESSEALAGKLCPRCSRMFFTAIEDDEADEYLCPHCGERIHAVPLTSENAPIAKPILPF